MRLCLYLFLSILPTFLSADICTPNSTENKKQVQLNEMRDIMLKVPYPSLITIDEEGRARARTMHAFEPDETMTIWLATRPQSRKIEQIRNNPNATLYYFNPEDHTYVTLVGTAEPVDDLAIKKLKRRKEDTPQLYPNFPEDYTLIKVTPQFIEGFIPNALEDSRTWKPVRIELSSIKQD